MPETDPQKSSPHANDDRSPLVDMLTCIDCKWTMRIEMIAPDGTGTDLIRTRCKICQRIEIVCLKRRTWG